jgi:hypothetical protein
MASNVINSPQLTTLPLLSSPELTRIVSPFQGYEQQPVVTIEQAIQPLLSIVPDIERMLNRIKQRSNQLSDHLSPDESASILLYTLPRTTILSSFRFILNTTLRSQEPQKFVPWFLYLRLFMNALSKLPTIPLHTVYYEIKKDVTEEYPKGEQFIWWDFTSCMSSIEYLEKSTDENEARTIFIIECDSAKDIGDYLLDEDNNEIILYPARQYQIISSFDYKNQLKFIQLKEIQPYPPLIEIPQHFSSTLTTNPTSNTDNSIDNFQTNIIDRRLHHSKAELMRLHLTDAHISIVVQYVILEKRCQQLFLSHNNITSIGSLTIAESLKNNSTLKCLSLSFNNLRDEGVQYLANILSLNNSKLETLSLHATGITDEGVQHLVDMLENNTVLSWLYLGQNEISDQGVHLLTDALTHHNKTLKVLSLSLNKSITDTSVDYFIEMLKVNKSLETLWINDCNLSTKGQRKLQKMAQSNKQLFSLFVSCRKKIPLHQNIN